MYNFLFKKSFFLFENKRKIFVKTMEVKKRKSIYGVIKKAKHKRHKMDQVAAFLDEKERELKEIKKEHTICKFCNEKCKEDDMSRCNYCEEWICDQQACNDRFCWRYQCCESCEKREKEKAKSKKECMPYFITPEEDLKQRQMEATAKLQAYFGVVFPCLVEVKGLDELIKMKGKIV